MKVTDIGAFIGTLGTYGIFPYEYVAISAVAIILIESLVGFSLTLSIRQRWGIVASTIIFLLFDLFAIYSVTSNKGWVCNCFGSLFGSKITYSTILRNTALLASSVFLFLSKSSGISFDEFPRTVRHGITVILIFLFLFVVYESNSRLRDDPRKKSVALGDFLPRLSLVSIEGDSVRVHNRQESFTLLVFFTLSDCSSCLLESSFWESIHQHLGSKVSVIGIGHARNRDLLREWARVRGLHFPVVFDQNEALINRFAEETPFKIVVDHNNQVVLRDRSSDDEELQHLFYQELSQIANN